MHLQAPPRLAPGSTTSSPEFRASLAVELDRLPTVALVLLYRAEPVEDLTAPRSGLRGDSRLAQELPGALALAGLPGSDRGLDGAPVSPFLHVGGRQPPGELGQLCRGREGTEAMCPLGRVLELGGDLLIWALRAKRQVARTLLQVGKQLREAAMERSALGAVGLGIHARRQQWVREADAVVFELDHIRLERRRKPWLRISADGSPHERQRRLR